MKKSKKLAFATIASSVLLSATTAYGVTKATVNDVFIPSGEQTNGFVNTTSRGLAGQPDFTQVAEHTINSVVSIKNYANARQQQFQDWGGGFDPFEFFFGPGMGQQRKQQQPKQRSEGKPQLRGSGSGVIISADGYIVTNNHVVGNADVIDVKLNDNREFKGRIIGCDENTDLALIKIDGKDLPTVPIGNSDDLKLGQWVLAVGNPFNLTSTVTAGIVSAKARSLGANGIESFIQTDAAINAGNSGGALVNERGELVGINAMLYSQTGSYSGYGFAIPTSIMTKVVDDLKVYGTVQRAVLGVQGTDVTNYIDVEKAKGNEVDLGTVSGVYINEVVDASAAEDAGLQKGDVVTEMDGKAVHKMSELQEVIAQHRPGDKVKITYVRNKKTAKVEVTLRNSQGTTKVVEEVDMDKLGVQMKPLSESELKQMNLQYGLSISAIRRGKLMTAGATKGTIIIQVNDRKMESVSDWEQAVEDANRSTDRTLWIKALTPSGRKVSYVIDLNE